MNIKSEMLAVMLKDEEFKEAFLEYHKLLLGDFDRKLEIKLKNAFDTVIKEIKEQPGEEELLTQKEVMKILKISRQTLLKLRKKGTIKDVRLEGKAFPYFKKSEVLAQARN